MIRESLAVERRPKLKKQRSLERRHRKRKVLKEEGTLKEEEVRKFKFLCYVLLVDIRVLIHLHPLSYCPRMSVVIFSQQIVDFINAEIGRKNAKHVMKSAE